MDEESYEGVGGYVEEDQTANHLAVVMVVVDVHG